MKTVVQMSGRGVRHKDDFCTTYILDSRAGGFIDRCTKEGLAPKWWLDGIQLGNWRKEMGLA